MFAKNLIGAVLVLALVTIFAPARRSTAEDSARLYAYLEGKDCEIELIPGGATKNGGSSAYIVGKVVAVDQFGMKVTVKKMETSAGTEVKAKANAADEYIPWAAVLTVQPK
jgi:hypothetical protein